MKKNKPRILVWDLEVLNIAEKVEEIYFEIGTYPGRTIKASINSVICAGYKWLGEKQTHCINAWDFPEWKKNVNDDKRVLKEFRKVIAEADGMITHNGEKFDLKFLNTRLLLAGLDPLPKIPHVDTCQVARKKLLMFKNRLGYLAAELGVEDKMDTGGRKLWLDVKARKPGALKKMTAYCKQDVNTLEQVFLKLRPLAEKLPNYNLFMEPEAFACPSCGSGHLNRAGKIVTKTRIYDRYRCMTCGTYSKVDLKGKNPRTY